MTEEFHAEVAARVLVALAGPHGTRLPADESDGTRRVCAEEAVRWADALCAALSAARSPAPSP